MRHRNKTKIFDREKAHRDMMLKNLASNVVIYERVKTTVAKAKVARSLVDKLVTLAKKNNLSAHKKLIQIIPQPLAIKKLKEVLADRFKERAGGYTRVVKTGTRVGDGADMAYLELVDRPVIAKK